MADRALASGVKALLTRASTSSGRRTLRLTCPEHDGHGAETIAILATKLHLQYCIDRFSCSSCTPIAVRCSDGAEVPFDHITQTINFSKSRIQPDEDLVLVLSAKPPPGPRPGDIVKRHDLVRFIRVTHCNEYLQISALAAYNAHNVNVALNGVASASCSYAGTTPQYPVTNEPSLRNHPHIHHSEKNNGPVW